MAIAPKLLEINQVKEDLKQAIIDKGVSMTGVPFTEYADKVAEISGGGGGETFDTMPLTTDNATFNKIPLELDTGILFGTYQIGGEISPLNINTLLQTFSIDLDDELVVNLLNFNVDIVTVSQIVELLSNWLDNNIGDGLTTLGNLKIPQYMFFYSDTSHTLGGTRWVTTSIRLTKENEEEKIFFVALFKGPEESKGDLISRIATDIDEIPFFIYGVDFTLIDSMSGDDTFITNKPTNTIGDHDTFIGLVNDGWIPTMHISAGY